MACVVWQGCTSDNSVPFRLLLRGNGFFWPWFVITPTCRLLLPFPRLCYRRAPGGSRWVVEGTLDGVLVQGVLYWSCSLQQAGSIYCQERNQFPLLLNLMLASAL